jgi:hypothetical protein
VSAKSVLDLVRSNIALVAFQDRAARENMLGDHGVRHLTYDIAQGERILDAVEARGQRVPAIDRLVLHQAVILHDAGYAMHAVRDAVNAGATDAQEGHNVLAARHVRERMADESDPLCAMFEGADLARVHAAVLHHDSSDISFVVGESTQAARDRNLFCAIRLADNTHAFESKLPELLLEHPRTLRTMRVLLAAADACDESSASTLARELKQEIGEAGFAVADARVLQEAVDRIDPRTIKKSINRLGGAEPQIEIDARGHATVTVRESPLHDEVSALFAIAPHARLKKLAGDLLGVADKQERKRIDVEQRELVGEHVSVRFKTGAERRHRAKTPFEVAVRDIVREPAFNRFAVADTRLALLAKIADRALDDEDGERGLARAVAKLGLSKEAQASSPKLALLELRERIRKKRRKLVRSYLEERSVK